MEKTRVLTGITTSGTPHLGNYVGAIGPAVSASQDNSKESFFFLADYHAIIKASDPEIVRQSSKEIAATWLALGLDTDNGGEFLNYLLFHYCQDEGITFTRSRPYRENDQCHVEQKNGSIALAGYHDAVARDKRGSTRYANSSVTIASWVSKPAVFWALYTLNSVFM